MVTKFNDNFVIPSGPGSSYCTSLSYDSTKKSLRKRRFGDWLFCLFISWMGCRVCRLYFNFNKILQE